MAELPQNDAPLPVKASPSNQRCTIEQMHLLATQRGGRCISTAYVNTDVPLQWECDQLHQWDARPSSIKRGSWCRVCSIAKTRHSLNALQALAHAHDGELLSTRYVHGGQKLQWQCGKGHTWSATASSVQVGNWCKLCYHDSIRYTLDDMHALAAEKGGICLATEYVSNAVHLTWRCERGHTWQAIPSTVRTSWCPECSFDRKRLGIEKMRQLAEERGGKCLSDAYKNVNTKLTWRCHLGHIWDARPEHIRRGHWCHECNHIRLAAMREDSRRRRKEKCRIPNLL